ncbi:MAG: ornithine cyclodeaminase family protein [Coriobacteriales bacterium]|jgi:ornithine cyclodeaminase/alanine dehydrogenase-like protein (mu-crystallin family)|nr:ornithine cyclodeaminase family protein [Coriobacteriales bacterium]
MSDSHAIELLFLNHDEVAGLLSVELVLAAVREVFLSEARGELITGPATPMPVSPAGWLMAMPSSLTTEGVAGVKWLGYFERAPESGIPTSWGNLLILNHIHNGLPYALLDATDITARRTAGGHAVVAAQALARTDANSLAILGTGVQAEAGIIAFDKAFELERITVYSRTRAHLEQFIKRFDGAVRAKLIAVESPETLVRQADILLTCSAATSPVIRAEWIKPGTTVIAVSAFHDLDPGLASLVDRWYLGNRTSDWEHIVEHPEFADKLRGLQVSGTLGEVLSGKLPGREHDGQRILFTHMGMGALDLAVGDRVYKRALERGVGQWLRLA